MLGVIDACVPDDLAARAAHDARAGIPGDRHAVNREAAAPVGRQVEPDRHRVAVGI